MSIQSSINNALFTASKVKGVNKLSKGQNNIKSSIDKTNEYKELNVEKQALEGGLNAANSQYLESDETLWDTETEAMNTIDEFYSAQESGEPTDIAMYNKAMQSYREKIQAARLQQQGSIEWRNQLNERLKQVQGRMDDIKKGGNK